MKAGTDVISHNHPWGAGMFYRNGSKLASVIMSCCELIRDGSQRVLFRENWNGCPEMVNCFQIKELKELLALHPPISYWECVLLSDQKRLFHSCSLRWDSQHRQVVTLHSPVKKKTDVGIRKPVVMKLFECSDTISWFMVFSLLFTSQENVLLYPHILPSSRTLLQQTEYHDRVKWPTPSDVCHVIWANESHEPTKISEHIIRKVNVNKTQLVRIYTFFDLSLLPTFYTTLLL